MDIAADYECSMDRLPPLFAELGMTEQGPGTGEIRTREAVLATLASLDADAYLRAAGLGEADLAAVRARLLGSGTGISRP